MCAKISKLLAFGQDAQGERFNTSSYWKDIYITVCVAGILIHLKRLFFKINLAYLRNKWTEETHLQRRYFVVNKHWEDLSHHPLVRKCQSKATGANTSCPRGWLASKFGPLTRSAELKSQCLREAAAGSGVQGQTGIHETSSQNQQIIQQNNCFKEGWKWSAGSSESSKKVKRMRICPSSSVFGQMPHRVGLGPKVYVVYFWAQQHCSQKRGSCPCAKSGQMDK